MSAAGLLRFLAGACAITSLALIGYVLSTLAGRLP